MVSDLKKLITPDQALSFDRSQTVSEAVKFFTAVVNQSNYDSTLTTYTNTTDYLLTQIGITNSHRSDVLSNLTVDMFNDPTSDKHSI